MVWDTNSQTHKESNVDKKEYAMDFLISTTTTYDIIKD